MYKILDDNGKQITTTLFNNGAAAYLFIIDNYSYDEIELFNIEPIDITDLFDII